MCMCLHTHLSTNKPESPNNHKQVLRPSWKRLLKQAEARTDELCRREVRAIYFMHIYMHMRVITALTQNHDHNHNHHDHTAGLQA